MALNVALLLFGQLRWIDNPHTTPSHHQFIINKYRTDVFGHFWNPEKTEKLSQSGHVAHAPSPSDPNAPQKIQQQYDFSAIKFEDPIRFDFADTLYKKAKARDWPLIWQDGWFEWPNAFNNILSQQYTVQSVCMLFKQYCMRHPEKRYDFIILSRPDICIWDYPDLRHLTPGKFYLSNHHFKFPDLAFVFDLKYLPTFDNLYLNTLNITDDELYSLWEPNAEALKFNSFRKYFSPDQLNPIPFPVRIVRGPECRGPQW